MVQSMTGYGKSELKLNNVNYIVELRSLNSKHIDINLKIPPIYRDKEIELRKIISERLKRGKIELFLWQEKLELAPTYKINSDLVKDYYKQILLLEENLSNTGSYKTKPSEVMPMLLRMPNILVQDNIKLDSSEWKEVTKSVDYAISNIIKFRKDEGKKLEEDITLRVNNITNFLQEILPFSEQRIKKVKDNLSQLLLNSKSPNIDKNRLEQELIYYLEKQDITEEQVRLSSHLKYFTEIMKNEFPNGKKLGFISQEIGREINTIGSKSSHAEIQRIVVQMKDELEKIKEQLLNIL